MAIIGEVLALVLHLVHGLERVVFNAGCAVPPSVSAGSIVSAGFAALDEDGLVGRASRRAPESWFQRTADPANNRSPVGMLKAYDASYRCHCCFKRRSSASAPDY